MKKSLLLLSAAVLGFSAMAESEDITPKGYIFHESQKMCDMFDQPVHGSNIQNLPGGATITPPIYHFLKGEDLTFKDGFLVVGGGQFHDGQKEGAEALMNEGLQVVDLGGEIGHVFVMTGTATAAKAAAAIKAVSGVDHDIKVPSKDWTNWGNLNFFMDPDKSPTVSDARIKVEIVYNVYAEKINVNAMNNIQFKNNDNGFLNGKFQFEPLSSTDFFKEDPLTEEMTYDPTIWCRYSFITHVADYDEENEKGFTPARICMNFPASANFTLFIREIRFTKLPKEDFDETKYDAEDCEYDATAATKEFITLTPGKSAGVNEVVAEEAATVSVNGNTVIFSAPAVVYNLTGAQVAAGTEATLAKGIYVARIGEKAVKFAVK